jgi:bacterioferritin
MADKSTNETEISRDRLAELLNEDLCREYQAIISYVVYSQVLSGAAYMDIADQLEIHAKQELDHALTLSRQIDYLGKMPAVTPKPVRTSKDAKEMLRFDLENENETVRNYRDRIRQCEALGEYAMAEQIRQTGSSNRFSHRPRRGSSRHQQWPSGSFLAEGRLRVHVDDSYRRS